ncbi:hypothetical protein [uncultured Ruminococcus sp.]|uniref:hypothetical protein n=1 Tax=uncultured Ruminococcus sp. TaxID=165186 RepID=UPI0025CD7F8C|nr:hypothetical protein [uncultured Ruminococcus sp.]
MSYNKRILWIDDWPDAMRCMLSNVFHKLWDKKIRSEIAIFGDSTIDECSYTDSIIKTKVNELQEAAYSEFIAFLLGMANMDDNIIKDYVPLINTEKYEDFIYNPSSDIVKNCLPQYFKIKTDYDSRKDHFEEIEKNVCEELKLDKYDSVLIDLRLTSHDNNIFNNLFRSKEEEKQEESNQEKPLLSMIIYNYISTVMDQKNRPKVYLYSSYTEPIDFTDKWIQLYKKIYNNSKDIEIFNRGGKEIYNKGENLVNKIIS